MPELDSLWQFIYDHFKKQYAFQSFSTWFGKSTPIQLSDNLLVVEVPSPMHKDYWKKRISKEIAALIKTNFKVDFKIVVKLPNENNPLEKKAPEIKKEKPSKENLDFLKKSSLNSNYTFNSFVVGAGNQMAHAAALAVSEEPGVLYNPLYFHGGVGLGKTHLMHAIGNELLALHPKLRVKYVSSETFTNDFVNSIKSKRQEEFRKIYRNVDLLLVDDVQFFSKKPGTVDEFFHTFNDLYDEKKQIVLSSDRAPSMIEDLGDRLTSRFKWGLQIEINPPDYETRLEILKTKAQEEHIIVSEDVLGHIASQFKTNVRELEGGLTRVKAFAQIKRVPITVNLTDQALQALTDDITKIKLDIPLIQTTVAKYFEISLSELKGKKRLKRFVMPRQVAMYLARELTDKSLPKIGKEFGGKDHTTVLHACEKIAEEAQENPILNRDIKTLTKQLKN